MVILKVLDNVTEFVYDTLSRIYIPCVKDSLYCDLTDAPYRRAVQTVLYRTLTHINQLMAPITPFLCEETHHYIVTEIENQSSRQSQPEESADSWVRTIRNRISRDKSLFPQNLVDFFEYRFKPRALNPEGYWDHMPGVTFPFAERPVPDLLLHQEVIEHQRTRSRIPIYDPELRELEKEYILGKEETSRKKESSSYCGLFLEPRLIPPPQWEPASDDAVPIWKFAVQIYRIGLSAATSGVARSRHAYLEVDDPAAIALVSRLQPEETSSSSQLNTLLRAAVTTVCSRAPHEAYVKGPHRTQLRFGRVYVRRGAEVLFRGPVGVVYGPTSGRKCPRCSFHRSEKDDQLCARCQVVMETRANL